MRCDTENQRVVQPFRGTSLDRLCRRRYPVLRVLWVVCRPGQSHLLFGPEGRDPGPADGLWDGHCRFECDLVLLGKGSLDQHNLVPVLLYSFEGPGPREAQRRRSQIKCCGPPTRQQQPGPVGLPLIAGWAAMACRTFANAHLRDSG